MSMRFLLVHHYGEVFQQQAMRVAYTRHKCILLKVYIFIYVCVYIHIYIMYMYVYYLCTYV